MAKILKVLAGLLALLLVVAFVVFRATGPQRPDADSASALWLASGPYKVSEAEFLFVDESRPTAANGDVPGKPQRSFPVTLWYPRDLDSAHPLVIHSHGILSSRSEMPYVAEALASHGYVVAAADFPLSSGATEGGATADDVGNQPADISFLIDSVLALSGSEKPFAGTIDVNRIGLSGYSLGGLTTNLATYHPRLRDTRIKAAVSIAGLSAVFSPQFFTTTNIPYLAISGTADALLEFQRNAADLPSRNPHAVLIGIEGGTHLGFMGVADPVFRFADNPDTLGCQGVLAAVGEDPNAIFTTLGSADEGIDMQRSLPNLCDYGFPPAVHPGRQKMITQIAVLSFFESVFADDGARRNAAREVLLGNLAGDFTEVILARGDQVP